MRFKVGSRMFHGCFNEVSEAFNADFKVVSRVCVSKFLKS